MDLRPRAARWFEVVVPFVDVEDATEALARTGEVQFERKGEPTAAAELGPLQDSVSRYRDLSRHYARFWPEPLFEQRCCALPVEASARSAVRVIERWVDSSSDVWNRLQGLSRERQVLDEWVPILDATGLEGLDLRELAAAGPALHSFCLIVAQGVDLELPSPLLLHSFPMDERRVLLGLASPERKAELCAKARRLGGICLDLPDWFEADAETCRTAVSRRRGLLDRRIQEHELALRTLAERAGVDRAAGVLERVEWFLCNAEQIRCNGDLCWITGWTSQRDPRAMNLALQKLGVGAAVSFVDPAPDASSPSVTRHPVWLRAFEVFNRAVGVPGLGEADPTTWVAILVPLMFGYMCGDVGHGAVILITGLLVRGRTELWPLLVFAGTASIGFGFAYGDLFGYEGLIDPIWLRPLEHPVTVLLVPVLMGSLVLTLSILLHAAETCWRGEAGSEGVADAAQLLVYWGLLLAFVDLRLGWLVLVGAALCLSNRLRVEASPLALLKGFGHLLESSFTLLLNTLSFARVGAFALAHAALESAVFALADAVGSLAAAAVVLVVGNLAVILLEGLVVSIQTTRLVLFEFFLRFFEGRGRPFRPAPKPPGQGK